MEKDKSEIAIKVGGNDMKDDLSNIVTTGQEPSIGVTPANGFFISVVGFESVVQAFVIIGSNLKIGITATAPVNYQVSSDAVTWANTASFEAIGGALYVKYMPVAVETNHVTTITLSSTGVDTKNIDVTGLSFTPTIEQTTSSQTAISADNVNSITPKDNKFWVMLKSILSYGTVLFGFVLLLRIYELLINQLDVNIQSHFVGFVCSALMSDLLFFCMTVVFLFVFTGILYFISHKIFHILLIILCPVIVLVQLMLIKYFSIALNPLGSDLFQYSMAEIKQTVGPTVNLFMMLSLGCLIVVFVLSFIFLPRFLKINKSLGLIFSIICLLGVIFQFNQITLSPKFGSEYNNNLALNKSTYFYKAVWRYYFPPPEQDIFDEMSEMFADNMVGNSIGRGKATDFKYIDEVDYPFLHTDSTRDVLSPFFKTGNKAPNIVFIVVEGLGRAFTNENAYLGSFTPFLDSLSQHSLYWENCLSTAGRTFEVLPSVLASLPYGQHGFAELGGNMPRYLGLISVLGANNYHTSFFYAGDSKFDNMNLFVKRQNITTICDVSTFGPSYKKLPTNAEGFTWGYGDFELFRKYLSELDKFPKDRPHVSVLLTVSTHSPFKVNDQAKYDALFEKRILKLKLDATTVGQRKKYKAQYASILFMDDAMRHFFSSFKSRPSYQNTIFIITGDHRMPDIPMSTKIDRYHIPLIIYSPMLKRTAKFSAVVSHLDITPSLLAFEKYRYHIKLPSLVTWIGGGLDTVRYFRNNSSYPLIPTKQGVSEYLSGNYMISGNDVFQLSANMGLEPIDNADNERTKLSQLLNKFTQRNDIMTTKRNMLPDSILARYNVK